MRLNSVGEIFEKIAKLKVLIIGDVMVDRYSYGAVSRISPEAPVPVVNINQYDERLGGAANVALNIRSLGAEPFICTVIGSDQDGDCFMRLLESQNLYPDGVLSSKERVTTVKHRVLSGSQHLLRIDTEKDLPLNAHDNLSLKDRIKRLLPKVDVIIFEDYDKGVLGPDIISFVLNEAAKWKIPSAADPKRKNFYHYAGCTLFKPNFKELVEGLGISPAEISVDFLNNAMGRLLQKAPVANVLVTLSKNGIYYHSSEDNGIIAAHRRDVSDISGAGDTAVSIAAAGLGIGLPLRFIAELANLGGGIVCEYQGVVPVDVARLVQEALKSKGIGEYL